MEAGNQQQFQAEVMDELRQRDEMDAQDKRDAMLEELYRDAPTWWKEIE